MPYPQAQTGQITLDNISPQAITAPVACSRISIRENSTEAATTRYNVYVPTASDAPFQAAIGELYKFGILPIAGYVASYQAGQIVGYIELLDSASAVFNLVTE